MSLELSDPSVRKSRQRPAATQDKREVQVAVAPIVARISSWQVALTLVKAKSSKGNADPMQLTGACRAIAQEVASGRRILHRAIPERLRGHGRVLDVERCLAMVEVQATDVLRELAGPSRPSPERQF